MGTYSSALGIQPNKLRRFWDSLRYLNGGGVDIVFNGDSLLRGLGSINPDTQSITAAVRKMLQASWNPDGVPGGAGFIPAKWTWSSNAGTAANPTHPSTRTSTAYDDRLMSGAGHYLVRLNAGGGGSVAFAGLTNITDLDAVHQINTGSVVTAGWAITGTASSSGTINSQGTVAYGAHTQAGTGLSAAGTYTWTLSPPSSGDVRMSGLIRYNGDYGAGIRVHNLGCSGVLLYDPSNNLGLYRADDLPGTGANTNAFFEANLDKFSTTAFGSSVASLGAVRAGLVVLMLGTNDESTYGATDGELMACKTIYKARLQMYVDRVKARTSTPCVLLVHLPTPTSRQTRMYTCIRDAMAEIATSNEDVAFADLDAYYGRVARASMPTGFDSDGTHWTATANTHFGQVLGAALLEMRREVGA